MQFIPGPDFPTGGIIVGSEGIHQAYSTGRGRLVVRGLAHIEEMGTQPPPHRHHRDPLPGQQDQPDRAHRRAGARGPDWTISRDLRDESDRRGMSIVIELKRGAQPKKVLNQLYKYTPLQSTFGVQLLALVDGEPRLLSLKRALQIYIEHRQEVITRRSAVRAGQSPRPGAHPGGLADRPGEPGRGDPDHPPVAGCRCGQGAPDGALPAERAAGAGHPGYAAAPPGCPGTAEDRG